MCHAEFNVLDRPVLPKIETNNQRVSLILEKSSLTFRQVRWKIGPPPERPADLGADWNALRVSSLQMIKPYLILLSEKFLASFFHGP